jgi:multisubunit Na+/H+ antiporter MnhE subunit
MIGLLRSVDARNVVTGTPGTVALSVDATIVGNGWTLHVEDVPTGAVRAQVGREVRVVAEARGPVRLEAVER